MYGFFSYVSGTFKLSKIVLSAVGAFQIGKRLNLFSEVFKDFCQFLNNVFENREQNQIFCIIAIILYLHNSILQTKPKHSISHAENKAID